MAPKVVLITGCSTGIGFETAVLLASDKSKRFKVFATMRNLAKKAQLEKTAGNTLNKTLFIRELDVTKKASTNTFMEKLNSEEGGVDILINNAGVGQAGVVDQVSEEEIRNVYETNVFGLIRLTQAVIPGMKAKKSGHIVNVGSLVGLFGYPFADIYVSSKFAVEGFSESLAPYLLQFNVSVSIIEPGPVQTAFAENRKANNSQSEVDGLTQELRKKANEANMTVQSGKDIAAVIQEVILADKPHLRYPTSEDLVKLAALKYKDTTGDSVVNVIVGRYGWTISK